jgi:hypothetical protein
VRQKRPEHDCREHWVPLSVAAAACGVPYQYIFGRVKRAQQPAARVNGKWYTCQVCSELFYGKTQDDNDLRAEPIQAYRGWVVPDPIAFSKQRVPHWLGSKIVYLLHALNQGEVWDPKGIDAKCNVGRTHEAPARRCSCGIYALKSAKEAIRYVHSYASVSVVGAVDLWGKFVEGDNGYKAQHAKVTALLCNNAEMAEIVHDLATEYNVPVVHSVKALEETNWGQWATDLAQLNATTNDNNANTVLGETDEHWSREEVGRGPSEADPRTAAGSVRAACRIATRGASSLEELKRLYAEGLISSSNVVELLWSHHEV